MQSCVIMDFPLQRRSADLRVVFHPVHFRSRPVLSSLTVSWGTARHPTWKVLRGGWDHHQVGQRARLDIGWLPERQTEQQKWSRRRNERRSGKEYQKNTAHRPYSLFATLRRSRGRVEGVAEYWAEGARSFVSKASGDAQSLLSAEHALAATERNPKTFIGPKGGRLPSNSLLIWFDQGRADDERRPGTRSSLQRVTVREAPAEGITSA